MDPLGCQQKAIWARFDPPDCRALASPQKGLCLGLDGPNCDPKGSFPPCDPPLLVVSTHQAPGRLWAAYHRTPQRPNFGPQNGPKVSSKVIVNPWVEYDGHPWALSGPVLARFDRPIARCVPRPGLFGPQKWPNLALAIAKFAPEMVGTGIF